MCSDDWSRGRELRNRKVEWPKVKKSRGQEVECQVVGGSKR